MSTAPERIALAARNAADALSPDARDTSALGNQAAMLVPVSKIHVTAWMGGIAHTAALLIRVLIGSAPNFKNDATRAATRTALFALADLVLRLTAPEETVKPYYVDRD